MTEYRGCNLTGGETDYRDWLGASPKSGQHYLFVSTADIDTCIASGMNAFRLLFSWEAVTQDSLYKTTLLNRVSYIVGKGCKVILDIHPGDAALAPGYKGTKIVPNSSQEVDLVNLWANFASMYKLQPLVEFGIMNEPNGIPVANWYSTAQKVLTGIRATGNTSWVWMPGANWSGAGDWVASNGSAWNLVDPAKKLGVQAHLYFDQNAGGGDTTIANAQIGATRLKNVTDWARGRGLRVLLGEVGLSASNGLAASAWANLMAYADANADVVAGWLFWAYGPPAWWSGYEFTLNNNSKQLQLIQSWLKATPAPVPVPVPVPTDPRDATIADLTVKLSAAVTQSNTLSAQVAALQRKILNAQTDLA